MYSTLQRCEVGNVPHVDMRRFLVTLVKDYFIHCGTDIYYSLLLMKHVQLAW